MITSLLGVRIFSAKLLCLILALPAVPVSLLVTSLVSAAPVVYPRDPSVHPRKSSKTALKLSDHITLFLSVRKSYNTQIQISDDYSQIEISEGFRQVIS